MPTIGIDYTPAYEQGGGIGRYVRELVAALAQQDTQTTYHLFVAGVANPLPPPPADNFLWRSTPLSTKWLARIWHRARMPLPVEVFAGPITLFHATDFVLPPALPTTRTMLTVHDLSFIRSPETASPRLRRYLMHVVPRSVQQADHILADSEATKADLIDIYHVEEAKITVLLSGVDARFQPVIDKREQLAVRQKYQIPENPYIFSIGTIQPRKNYARLVEALSMLRSRGHDLHLVIAGGRGWLEDEIYTALDRFKMRSYVHFIGYADDSDLPALYTTAACSSFVSLYEGFGLPVLESMACGTPVITANVSSLPEVAGDAAPMVAPDDVEAIAGTIERIVTDSVYYNQLRQRGLAHARSFTWERSARQLRDVYQFVLQGE